MAVSLAADTVLFSIHSAIRLSAALRKAFADSLRARELTLPLPAFDSAISETTIEDFFNEPGPKGGKQFLGQIERLDALHEKAEISVLSPEERAEYEEYYRAFFQTVHGKVGELGAEELVGLFRIRQWQQGRSPTRSPLQMVAGTLVEIGIDYFNQVPGALRPDSALGLYLTSVLQALDEVQFGQAGSLKAAVVQQVLPRLFIAAAETAEELGLQHFHDDKWRRFVQATSQGIAQDLYQRIEAQSTIADTESTLQWGQTVFRSLLRHSGEFIFQTPKDFFQTNEGVSQLISSTGLTLLDTLLDDSTPGVNFRALFEPQALDRLVKSALQVVAAHPEIAARPKALQSILKDLAQSLSAADLQQAHLLPEVARLVLEKTADNLELLWNVQDPDAKNLLVTASREILGVLATPAPDGKWKPRLSPAQLLAITEDLLDEVVENPGWITRRLEQGSLMRLVLEEVFESLAQLPPTERLQPEAIRFVLEQSLYAVALSDHLLDQISWGTQQEKTTVLRKALDLIFLSLNRQTEVVDKVLLLGDLLEYILESLLARHPDQRGLYLAQLILSAEAGVLRNGQLDQPLAEQLAEAALEVLAAHPETLTPDLTLQRILASVAATLNEAGLSRPDLLPEFLRLMLQNAALQAQHFIDVEEGEPAHLLLSAFRQLVAALTAKPPEGTWRPRLSPEQVLRITEQLLDEVVNHPEWLSSRTETGSLFQLVLDTTFQALQTLPPERRLSEDTLLSLLQKNLEAVALSPQVLDSIPVGSGQERKAVLGQALEILFTEDPEAREDEILRLQEFLLKRILARHPDHLGLALLDAALQTELRTLRQRGRSAEWEELLEELLEVLVERPELASGKVTLQILIRDVAAALLDAKLPPEELLPETLRLLLEHSADNLDNLIDTSRRKDKHLLVQALRQTLKALSARTPAGTWKPSLTPNQLLEILDSIFRHVVNHPDWVRDDNLRQLLLALFDAMTLITTDKKLHPSTVHTLVDAAIEAVNFRRTLLLNFVSEDGSTQRLAITYSLRGLFLTLYDKNKQSVGTWTLTQTPVINALLRAYLQRLARLPADKTHIDQALAPIQSAINDLNNDTAFVLEDLLDKLEGG